MQVTNTRREVMDKREVRLPKPGERVKSRFGRITWRNGQRERQTCVCWSCFVACGAYDLDVPPEVWRDGHVSSPVRPRGGYKCDLCGSTESRAEGGYPMGWHGIHALSENPR